MKGSTGENRRGAEEGGVSGIEGNWRTKQEGRNEVRERKGRKSLKERRKVENESERKKRKEEEKNTKRMLN